ncbi:hypothetical protein [Draconibacterium sediminis]|uniref:hypothetical protein n=1 Tax=Draconibacterium sediminis TaxID=1544798 RepID=UPI0026EA4899|nr:hypothetical protein [Draconibacterium sediminis]
MKNLSKLLFVFALIVVCLSTIAKTNFPATNLKPAIKGTIVIRDYRIFDVPIICNGETVGSLVGEVKFLERFHQNLNMSIVTCSGTVEGTGIFQGEQFKINYHAKFYFGEDFNIELHFNTKGDKDSKIIVFGTFDLENGPVSLKAKCF